MTAHANPKAASPPQLQENIKFRIWLRGEPVLLLRQMLTVAGIKTVPAADANRYDLQLMEAVRQFQRREKLDDSGLPRKATIARLNRVVVQTLAAASPSGEPAVSPPAPTKVTPPAAGAPRPAPAGPGLPAVTPPTVTQDKPGAAPAKTPAVSNAPASPATPPVPPPAKVSPPAGQAPAAKAPAATEKPVVAPEPKTEPKKTSKATGTPAVSCAIQAGVPAVPAELPMIDRQSLDRQREAIARYEKIAAAGGFPAVRKPPKSGYCLGQDHSAVGSAIERLIVDGYLSAGHRGTTVYTQAVVDAVKQFQDAQGFFASGQIGNDTRAAMNVPIGDRLTAMRTSLQRLEKIFARGEWTADQVRVLVNLPSASVQVIGGDELIGSYKAIVGRDERQSPEFVATIPDLQIGPLWHVPSSIVARDIAKQMRADPKYLEKNNMRALRGGRVVDAAEINWRTGPFPELEQSSGPHNALGLMRFGTTKRGSYYLHGTSNPTLVNGSRAKRFLSSGCVRLADPALLASLILRGTPDADGSPWTLDKLRAQIGAFKGGWDPGPRIRLAKPVPLIWTYLTGWASRDGRVHFRPDSYERDEEAYAAINR